MSPFMAEMIGTMLLILLGDGVVANVLLNDTKGNNSGWMVITTAWGLAVFVGVVVAGPYSGAHLNPAVTIGLAIAGKFAWAKVLPYIAAQMLGAFIGAFLVWVMYYDHFKRDNKPDAILAVFCTGPAIRNYVSNIASEIIGAFVAVIAVIPAQVGPVSGVNYFPVVVSKISIQRNASDRYIFFTIAGFYDKYRNMIVGTFHVDYGAVIHIGRVFPVGIKMTRNFQHAFCRLIMHISLKLLLKIIQAIISKPVKILA